MGETREQRIAQAQADASAWERRALAAKRDGNEGRLRYCLRRWDEAMDAIDAALVSFPAATPKGGAK